MITHITAKAIKDMVNDAAGTFPDECCGFLFGRETAEERIIEQVLAVNNAKEGDKRRRFEITPRDYLGAEGYADENNLLLLGVYHSHPNHPAIPSEHDRLAAQPNFSYVILSIINNEYAGLRSWRLNEEQQFEEEKIYDRQFIQKI
jgi:proteasome lid subunit RPN8/RPN11